MSKNAFIQTLWNKMFGTMYRNQAKLDWIKNWTGYQPYEIFNSYYKSFIFGRENGY